MERALVQVQSLRDALKVTAALITKNSSALSEVIAIFMSNISLRGGSKLMVVQKSPPCLELVLDLADVLVAATGDAVALQNSFTSDARDVSCMRKTMPPSRLTTLLLWYSVLS